MERGLTGTCRLAWGLAMLVFSICGAIRPLSGQELDERRIQELLATPLPTEPAELLALVGDVPILVGDILPKVDRRIRTQIAGKEAEIPEEELKIVRLQMMRGILAQTIQLRMLGQVFVLDKVGAVNADQRKEAQGQIAMQATKSFYSGEVPRMMKELKLSTVQELDQKLREKGSSLEIAKEDYVGGILGRLMIQQMIPQDPEVNLNEIHEYYDQHQDQYQRRAKARWEQLTVLFSKFPSRQAAYEAISEMGREAYFGGNVQTVAKEKSQEPLASSGGVHDWTNQGSLRSKPLDEQLFLLPLNRLSQIIEDQDGLHIVRILERREAGVTPLSEVQDEIRKKLKEQKSQAAEKELMERISRDVPVWTRFPQDIPGSQPLDRLAVRPGETSKR